MGAYISFNLEEQGLLNGADYDSLALYFFLKQKCNFKTGAFGTFKNQRFRYLDLCAALYRPASFGRHCRDFDEPGVKALLGDLERLGLVVNRQFDGDRLTMELPLSRKWGKNATIASATLSVPAAPAATETPAIGDDDPFSDIPDELLASFRKASASLIPASIPSSSSSICSSVMISTDSNDSTDLIEVMNPNEPEQEHEDAMRDEIGDGGALPIEAGEGDIELPDECDADVAATELIQLVDEFDTDDDDIDAPDFSEWQDMMAYALSGSLPDNECAEHHAPHGH
jgi:hypothetical protein